MMRRSLTSRLAGLLLAAWFAALSTELPALHSCPVHDGGASGGHAHMTALSHMHDAPDHAPEHPDHHNARCTCFGACCCAPGATLPPTGIADIVATVSVGFASPPVAAETPRPAAPTFRLPPAIGPPALRATQLI